MSHKIIEEKESGWWVVYKDLDVIKSYLGSYKSKQTAIQYYPEAEIIPLESNN
jgi:hypothetical protein